MDKLKKLIDVKSIVTLSLTIGFLILAIKNNALQEALLSQMSFFMRKN